MSLSALDSIISLESTRLESAKQTASGFQSQNSTVQQQGISTAQSKTSMVLQKIDAQYSKECAEADVRKLERKLVRERKAEKMALATAVLTTAASAVGNLWDAGQDIFNKRQKSGEIPDYMKSSNIQTKDSKGNSTATFGQTLVEGSTGGIGYVSGPASKATDDGAETVYSYRFAGNGSTSSFRAATITGYDKDRILGKEYGEMKAKNGGKDLTFAQIREQDPKMAEKLMADKMHDMSSDEAQDFMDVFEQVRPKNNVSKDYVLEDNSSSNNEAMTAANQLAAIHTTGKPVPDEATKAANQLAAVGEIVSPKDADPKVMAERLAAAGALIKPQDLPKGVTPESLIKDANSPDAATAKNAKQVINQAFENSINRNKSIISSDQSAMFLTARSPNGNESLQISTKKGVLFAPNITPENRKEYLSKYGDKSIAEISQLPGGKEDIRKMMTSMMEKDGAIYNTPMKSADMQALLPGNEDVKGIPDGSTINSVAVSNPDLAAKLAQASAAKVYPGDQSKPAVHMITASQARDVAQSVQANDKAVPFLKDGLKAAGKMDKVGVGDIAKAGLGFLVNTAQASVPYFQAYLAAKNRADNIQDELIAAMDKLAAANRKLMALEMQIDLFSGRGA